MTGTVSGTVKDAQGATIPGATVTLISESRGTTLASVVTNAEGDFVIPNITADTYTLQVAMPSFKMLKRTGLAGQRRRTRHARCAHDRSRAPHRRSGRQGRDADHSGRERREVLRDHDRIGRQPPARPDAATTRCSASCPVLQVNPGGLTPASRLGGGGDSNFMLDGATSMDPGVNRPATRVSVEAIQEVRVATSTYQAEYGRASGLQVNAVTKSGTNRFLGSIYDVERDSKWNSNSQTNILNGDPKPFQDERDYGFSIGGPVGKPGGANKLFFFFTQEMQPRTVGGDVTRYRMPTLLERQGDFSQTTNNLGQPYPYIKDPSKTGACNATSQVACFADGGVVGKIPQSALYAPGMAILNWYPLPNMTNVPVGQAYNFETTYPEDEPARLSAGHSHRLPAVHEPARQLQVLRVPAAERSDPGHPRGMERHARGQLRHLGAGREPQLDGRQVDVRRVLLGRQLSPSGRLLGVRRRTELLSKRAAGERHRESQHGRLRRDSVHLPGRDACSMPGTFAYDVISRSGTTIWDGTRVQVAPTFTWDGRVANSPPNNIGPFGNFILDTNAQNFNVSVTRLMGQHTAKVGYYYYQSMQRRGEGPFNGAISFANDEANNPFDTSFPFANAAIGTFQTYSAAVALGGRRVPRHQPRGVHPGQLEGQAEPDARLRPAVRPPGAAVRRVPAGGELLPGGMEPRAGADAVRRRLRERRARPARARRVRR